MARTLVGAAGVAVAVFSLLIVDTAPGTTYGDASIGFAVLEVAVGVGLLLSALALLSARPNAALGGLAVAAAAAWFAPLWVGWDSGPSFVRGLILALAPLLPVIVLAIAALVPPAVGGVGRFALVGLVLVCAAATTVASVAVTLVREPLRDPYCWTDCTVNVFLVHDDVQLARRLALVVLGLGAASGALAAVIAAVRLASAPAATRRSSGPALTAAGLSGLALAGYAIALAAEPRESPDRPLYEWLFAGRGLALLGLAAGLAWLTVKPRLVRSRVSRLAVDLERSAAEGGIGQLLGRVLDAPGLRIGYPVGTSDRIVGADGLPIHVDPLRRTALLDEEGVVAVVESDAVSAFVLERELGPAAHLALGNERLRAEALARLTDVTDSRARIVETADAARQRMERDLHDGAQQRMLALTYDLRVALTLAESKGDERTSALLRGALDRALAASQELRDVAHGIFPAELATSGLEAALESLADLRPLRLTLELPPGRRYRSDVETAAYAVVAEAVEGAGELDVAIVEADGALQISVQGGVDWGERMMRLEDRIGAAGGSVRASERRLEATLPLTPPR